MENTIKLLLIDLPKARNSVLQYFGNCLQQFGLTAPQLIVLSELCGQEGEIYLSELIARIHLGRPTVSGILERLEAKNFLKRRALPSNRAHTLLEASMLGRLTYECAVLACKEEIDRLLRSFEADDCQQLDRLLDRLAKACQSP